jgi:hypothetical protein
LFLDQYLTVFFVRFIIAFACTFFCATFFANAQILIGPIAGGHVSWTRFDEKEVRRDFKSSPLFAYHAGVSLSFRVRSRFYLHSAILYARKGKLIEGVADPLLRNRVIYNHIDLPILYTAEFKGKIGRNKVFKWYLGAGPNVSYWLNGKGTLRTSEIVEGGIDELEYTVAFNQSVTDVEDDKMAVLEPNRLQLGLNISVGTVFEPVGLNKFMVNLRYEIGHSFLGKSNALNPLSTEYADILRSRNNGIRLSIAYLIDLKIDQRKKGKSTIDKRKL